MTDFHCSRLFAVLVAGAAAMTMIAVPASAQGVDPEDMMTRADANRDGDISRDELIALRTDSFERLDRNGDGVISADDAPGRPFVARFNAAFERVQSNFDVDRDGQVTRGEMLDAPAPVFEQGDVDGDDVVTAEEIATLRERRSAF